jgi:hypothetical protein
MWSGAPGYRSIVPSAETNQLSRLGGVAGLWLKCCEEDGGGPILLGDAP